MIPEHFGDGVLDGSPVGWFIRSFGDIEQFNGLGRFGANRLQHSRSVKRKPLIDHTIGDYKRVTRQHTGKVIIEQEAKVRNVIGLEPKVPNRTAH